MCNAKFVQMIHILKLNFKTSIRYWFILLVTILSNTGNLNAQTEIFLNLGTTFEQVFHRDSRMSPLIYSGNSYGGLAGLEIDSRRFIEKIDVVYTNGVHNNGLGNSLTFHRFRVMTYALYKRRQKENQKFYWGFSNQNNYTYRNNRGFSNFSEHYEYFTSFGPAASLRMPFKLGKHRFSWEGTSQWQVIGFMLRPSFISAVPPGYEVEDVSLLDGFFKSLEGFYPGKAWNFGLSTKLSHILPSGNKLQLSYEFEYYTLNTNQPVSLNNHNFILQISSKLR